ncbi:general transcription factor IIF subunit 2-like [Aethina tumida]|uniref:general transcription factor IIF subunit 2-like n=1 Tax=Aethina tumida TaxID=116153 RepID=UPI00096ADFD0|nr:general transcription factor IIF subunit 2-like [Aethina tumida]
MSEKEPKDSNSHNVDLRKLVRNAWLVKIPKFVAQKWEEAPIGSEVARLRITSPPKEVFLELSPRVMNVNPEKPPEVPMNYVVDITPVEKEKIIVFSEDVPYQGITPVGPLNMEMECNIIQRLSCRPNPKDMYKKVISNVKTASLSSNKVQILDRAVTKFKPVSDHQNNIDYNRWKKTEGRRVREDKDVVLQMLFKVFENHQYYNIKDLVRITKQPIGYLKEILKEYCVYNMKTPHKYMWELKPEYRHYTPEAAADNDEYSEVED